MTTEPTIRHSDIETNGIAMHVAEAGDGPAVLLCHGFPESWYSWRHQLATLAGSGYRAIAPDMRGYGGTDAPEDIADYTILHLVGDMVGLLDALGIGQAVIVGHDWGAPVAWHAALMRPDRFRAVAGLSVPFTPRGPASPLDAIRAAGWTSFYQLHFQEPGRAEGEFERDVAAAMRRTLWTLSAGPDTPWDGTIGEKGALESFAEPPGRMDWISEDDLAVYVAAFEERGFRGPLNWYRNIDRNWALTAPFAGAVIRQPACFVTGARDPILPLFRKAIDALPERLPDYRGTTIVEGAGHWVQQEAAAAVDRALIDFLAGLPQP